ncbi:MAG: proline--tRNA ligase [Verrucomicrobiota bacterium]
MRLSNLIGQRLKETPKTAEIPSHIYLIRGGYIRPVTAGIYSLCPLGKRITRKIESIIREEMTAIGAQEALFPVVLPQDLWDESGRSGTLGPELLRFENRNGKPMVLGMTHEEAVVNLIRTEVDSYKQLPLTVYQIQTKYRDEARPRGGLIRVREFTMKDAYSFHAEQEDLDNYYQEVHAAYDRIFRRLGMPEVVSIQSDTGMMGGSMSHEFMALAESGEDTLFMSPDGKYKANRDVATADIKFRKGQPRELEKVYTPEQKTIEQVAAYLDADISETGKAVFYLTAEDKLVYAMIRGDIEVNETKLKNYLQTSSLELAPDENIRKTGAVPGYAAPMQLDRSQVQIVVDHSVAESSNLIIGANEIDYHYRNFNFDRDLPDAEVTDIATVRPGDPCPVTGEPLQMKRGIEVGNIFKLGTKYTESMHCHFLDANGKSHPMIMGCYGIGIERTMAAVIEQSHDDYGPIWPMSIAPYHVHICAINPKKEEVREAAETLYQQLLEAGIEVLYDDRGEKAGFMFNDADLIGIPLRLIVSPKTIATGQLEFKTRDGNEQQMLSLTEAVDFISERINLPHIAEK